MATSDRNHQPISQQYSTTLSGHEMLRAQFQLYRGIVARKHGIAVWLPDSPDTLSGPELEQWVTFLKDAAHLPPG